MARVLKKTVIGIFKVKGGDKRDEKIRVIEDLHGRYAGVIYHLCKRILGDKAEAQDAVQETFTKAYRFLDSFDREREYYPWLHKIGTNECLKILRTKRRKGTALLEVPDKKASFELDADERLHIRQIFGRLMNELDERGQHIFVSHYVAEMNQGQIAEELGISRRAVVKRLAGIRKRAGRFFEKGSKDE